MLDAILRKHVFSSLVAVGLIAGCAASASFGCVAGTTVPNESSDDVASDDSAITGSAAVSRAMEWVTAELQYCQSAWHQPDGDNACSSTCDREENPKWDAYHSDCSGLVSYAWGLPAPGYTTSEFAPNNTTVTHAIDPHDLEPGDALNIPGDHVILFKAWVTKYSKAWFIEEPGCSGSIKYAHEFESDVHLVGSTQMKVDYEGLTFTAIRYDGTSGSGSTGSGGGGCVPGSLYCGGDKVTGNANDLYRCTSGDHGTLSSACAHGCSVNPGSDDSCKAGSSAGDCVHNGLYCGGDKVDGNSSTLYRCTSGHSGTVVEHCASGCQVNSGSNDACRTGVVHGAGGCVHNGLYCGGDKVTGYRNTLYKCTSGDSGTEVQQCAHGCDVNAHSNDSCGN